MPYFFMSTLLLTEVWKTIRFWSNFRQVSNKKLGWGVHRFRFLCFVLFFFFFFFFFVGHHYAQTYTKNNKTKALIQTTRNKDEPNIVLMRKSYRISQHGAKHVNTHIRTAYKSLRKKGATLTNTKKTGSELSCSRTVSSYCLLQSTRHVCNILYDIIINVFLLSYLSLEKDFQQYQTVINISYHTLQPHKVQGKPLGCPVHYKSLHIVQDSHMLYSVVCLDDLFAGRDSTDVHCLGVPHQIHLLCRYRNH